MLISELFNRILLLLLRLFSMNGALFLINGKIIGRKVEHFSHIASLYITQLGRPELLLLLKVHLLLLLPLFQLLFLLPGRLLLPIEVLPDFLREAPIIILSIAFLVGAF
jgi:hypothetical protein